MSALFRHFTFRKIDHHRDIWVACLQLHEGRPVMPILLDEHTTCATSVQVADQLVRINTCQHGSNILEVQKNPRCR